MKANQKTILLAVLAVIDCIVGGVVIKEALTVKPKSQTEPVKMLELGQALVIDDDSLLALAIVEEEEDLEEEIETETEKIVYDGMTLEELAAKLNRSLNDTIANQGYLIASYSLEKGVDPYIATAIILHETGCTWSCSNLVNSCNNVGGQKGSGCGSYRYFSTLEEGIKGFIDNLAKNYFSKGLTTPEQINKKYAEDQTWYQKINSYVTKIKNK